MPSAPWMILAQVVASRSTSALCVCAPSPAHSASPMRLRNAARCTAVSAGSWPRMLFKVWSSTSAPPGAAFAGAAFAGAAFAGAAFAGAAFAGAASREQLGWPSAGLAGLAGLRRVVLAGAGACGRGAGDCFLRALDMNVKAIWSPLARARARGRRPGGPEGRQSSRTVCVTAHRAHPLADASPDNPSTTRSLGAGSRLARAPAHGPHVSRGKLRAGGRRVGGGSRLLARRWERRDGGEPRDRHGEGHGVRADARRGGSGTSGAGRISRRAIRASAGARWRARSTR